MKKAKILLLILPCVLCLLIGTANATIMLYTGVEGGSGDVQNVLFNEPGLIATGFTVQGVLNQTNEIVDFTGLETLTTPPGGQARVVAVDGSLNYLNIMMHDTTAGFGKIQFNIDALVSGVVNLTFADQDGTLFSWSPTVGEHGANWFTAIASDGEVIASATIASNFGAFIGISDVQQVRLGPGTGSNPVPEPATMLLLGFGLMGTAAFGRKKLFKK